MNTSKSLDEILEMVAVRSANQYGGFVGWEDDDEREEVIGEARAAIVEAVEGLIGPDVKTKELWPDATVMDSGSINYEKDRMRKAIKEWQ